MITPPDAPADTRMMRIVHEALRRDLRRSEAALRRMPPAPLRQQHAIARHLSWMMHFLRDHHRAEDDGLYALVRERDASAAALLDVMHADHEALQPAIAEVEAAAAALDSGSPQGPDRLISALVSLDDLLLPHLQREEDEMMPVVSSVLSDREWRAVEDEYNLQPKSFVELGREGHWLIDDASAQDREAVLSLVPPVNRFFLLHGFARSYRRQAAACWDGPPPRRVQKDGRCEVPVDADIDAVWRVVSDVTRVGEWSHECVGVSWLNGARAAAPGARFRGRNRAGIFRWGRICEVVAAEPYELVWRTVPTALFPDSTEWAIRLRGAGRSTSIEQTFTVVRAPKVLDALYALMIPAHRDRDAALTDDLRRLGELALASSSVRADGVAS